MAGKWLNSNMLDSGLSYLSSNATSVFVIKAYTAGDAFSTVTGNGVASVAVGSTNYALSSNGSNRRISAGSSAGAGTWSLTAYADSGASPDLHVAHVTGSVVLFVADETSDQVITNGNIVNLPAHYLEYAQPT